MIEILFLPWCSCPGKLHKCASIFGGCCARKRIQNEGWKRPSTTESLIRFLYYLLESANTVLCYFSFQIMIDCVATCLFLRDTLIEKQEVKTKSWETRLKAKNQYKCQNSGKHYTQVRLVESGKEEIQFNNFGHYGQNSQTSSDQAIHPLETHMSFSKLEDDIRAIREILEAYSDKKTKAEQKERNLREWKVICCITDRMFFIVYLLINICGIIVIFFGQGAWINLRRRALEEEENEKTKSHKTNCRANNLGHLGGRNCLFICYEDLILCGKTLLVHSVCVPTEWLLVEKIKYWWHTKGAASFYTTKKTQWNSCIFRLWHWNGNVVSL